MISHARNRALVLALWVILEVCVRDGRGDLEKQRPYSPGLETEAFVCKWPREAEALSCSTDTRGLVLALQVLLHSCLHDGRSGLSKNLRSSAPGLDTETLVCRPRHSHEPSLRGCLHDGISGLEKHQEALFCRPGNRGLVLKILRWA